MKTDFWTRTVISAVIIGLAVRIAAGLVFNYGYDVSHWAMIMANFYSGNGLYGLTGYFYTPVWGYFLSSLGTVAQLLPLGEWGMRVTAALGFEQLTEWYISANITSLSFEQLAKVPLYLVDLLDGYLIYRIVLHFTADRKKAELSFVLWFLCPLVIAVASVSAMFDNLVVLLLLICLILLVYGRWFSAGVFIAAAALTKLFPVFLVPLLVAYVFVKHRNNRRQGWKNFGLAAAGGLIAATAILLPQMLDGTLSNAFSFITSRAADSSGLLSQLAGIGAVVAYVLILIGSVILALAYDRFAGKNPEKELLTALLLNCTLIFFWPPAPQYLLLLLPFLTVYIASADQRFMRPWAVIVLGATVFAFANNFSLLLSLAQYSNLITIDTVVALTEWFQTPFLSLAKMGWMYYGGAVVQYLGILYLAVCEFRGRLMRVRFWKYPRNSSFDGSEASA